MSLFDLLFIVLFFATFVILVFILIAVMKGRRRIALRLLCILGASLGAYLLVVALVALASPQKILTQQQSRCFDEMCFSVTDVKVASKIGTGKQTVITGGKFYLVTIQVSCHGHGRAQSEAGVGISLVDAAGSTYKVSPAGQRGYETTNGPNPPLTVRVRPGESISTVQVFEVPGKTSGVSLHVSHSGPGLFIIGDDESPLHKPTLIRLQP